MDVSNYVGWIYLAGVVAAAGWSIIKVQSPEKRARKLKSAEEQEAYELGNLMPAAANLFTGEFTTKEADRYVSDLYGSRKGLWSRWCRMTHEERLEMGRLALEVYADPRLRAQQDKLIAELDRSIGWKRKGMSGRGDIESSAPSEPYTDRTPRAS